MILAVVIRDCISLVIRQPKTYSKPVRDVRARQTACGSARLCPLQRQAYPSRGRLCNADAGHAEPEPKDDSMSTTATTDTPTIDSPAPSAPPAPSLELWKDEPTPDATTEPAAETKVEATPEVTTEPTPEPAKQPEPKPHNRDAAIIQLQQRQTTFERDMKAQIENLGKSILDAVKAKVEPSKPEPAAAPATVKQAKADLTAKIAELESLDFIESGKQVADAIRPLVERLMELEGKPEGTSEATIAKLVEAELLKRDALQGEMAAKARLHESQRQEQLATFKQTVLAEKTWLTEQKLDQVIKQSESRFKKLFSGMQMDAETANERYAVIYNDTLEAAEASHKANPAPPAPVVTSTGHKSPAGTAIVPSGASSASPTSNGKAKVPLYVED